MSMDSTQAMKVVHKAVRRVIKELDCPLSTLAELVGESVDTIRQFTAKRPAFLSESPVWVKVCAALEIDLPFMVGDDLFPPLDTTEIKTARAELGITEPHSILRRVSHQRITFAVMGAARCRLREWGLPWRELGAATESSNALLAYMSTTPSRAPAVSQLAMRVATALALHLPDVLATVDVTDEIKSEWLDIHTAMTVSVAPLSPRDPHTKKTRTWAIDKAKTSLKWRERQSARIGRDNQPVNERLRSYPADWDEDGMGYTKADTITSVELDEAAPKKRSDCIDGPRPCPWYRCRYNNGSDFKHPRGGAPRVKFYNSPLRWTDTMPSNCALDHAANGGLTLDEVGHVLGLTRERVRQMEENALNKLAASGYDFTDLLGDGHEITRNIKPENQNILSGSTSQARLHLSRTTQQANQDATKTAKPIPLDTDQARLIIQNVESELAQQKYKRNDITLRPPFVDRSMLGKPAKAKPITNAQFAQQTRSGHTDMPKPGPLHPKSTKLPYYPPVENIPTVTLKPIPKTLPQPPADVHQAAPIAAEPFDRTDKQLANAVANVLASVTSETGLTRPKLAARMNTPPNIVNKMLTGKRTHWTSPVWVDMCRTLLISPEAVAARAQMNPTERSRWFAMIGYTAGDHMKPRPGTFKAATQTLNDTTARLAESAKGAAEVIKQSVQDMVEVAANISAKGGHHMADAIAGEGYEFKLPAPSAIIPAAAPQPAEDFAITFPTPPAFHPLNLSGSKDLASLFNRPIQAPSSPVLDIVGTAEDKALLSPQTASTQVEYAEAVLGEALAKIKAYKQPIDYRAEFERAQAVIAEQVQKIQKYADDIWEKHEALHYAGERLDLLQNVVKRADEYAADLQTKLAKLEDQLRAGADENTTLKITIVEYQQQIAHLYNSTVNK